jgi:hypothetical protein
MIDPKELMIGNRVLLQDNKTEVIISQIDNRSNLIEVELPDGGLILRKKGVLNPIPLTPSLLERYGFVKKGFGYTIQIENRFTTNLMVCQNENKWYLYIDQLDEDDSNDAADIIQVMTDLEHLHTLQNIIQTFTGKPLIK